MARTLWLMQSSRMEARFSTRAMALVGSSVLRTCSKATAVEPATRMRDLTTASASKVRRGWARRVRARREREVGMMALRWGSVLWTMFSVKVLWVRKAR